MAEIRSLIIALLLFTGVTMGLSMFYVDLTSSTNLSAYGLTAGQIANITPADLSSMQTANNITQQAKDIETKLSATPTNIPAVDVSLGYITAAIEALSLPLSATSLYTNMLADATTYFGLPAWVSVIIFGIIVIVIIFEIMSAYLKWKI